MSASSAFVCDDCAAKVPVWFAPNDVWNRVVPDRVGMICANCFIERADRSGWLTAWKLTPEFYDESAAGQRKS